MPGRQGGNNPDNQFIYPYNFVPDGGKRRPSDSNGKDMDRAFKKLHRIDGLCGRIEYTVKTLSPVFIPDPEGTSIYKTGDKEEDVHKVMDFFHVNDRLCIPSTSLKGPVRSVLEAATNSSFGVMESGSKIHFSYKEKHDDFNQKIGRWKNTRIECWNLAKCHKDKVKLEDLLGKKVGIKLYQLHTGRPVVIEYDGKNIITLPNNNTQEGTIQKRADGKKWQIVVSEKSEKKEIHLCPNEIIKKKVGLKVSFKSFSFNGKNRVYEIVYDKDTTWQAEIPGDIEGEFLPYRKGKYIRVIYKLKNDSIALPVNSDALENFKKLHGRDPIEDEVLYYRFAGEDITHFDTVASVKYPEKLSLQDITQSICQIKKPEDEELLCPATRLFGWTPDNKEQGQGIAGRVSFSAAWSDKTLADTIQAPLKILGGPKPQYYPFYLKPKDGTDPNEKAAYYADTSSDWHKTPGIIRGRKFYLHHPKAFEPGSGTEYIKRSEADISPENRKAGDEAWKNFHTNQNSTCAVLPAGAEFKGYIDFENLDGYELGMLLWVLTLSSNPYASSQKHAHKIGMGKGIGMGSVRFEIANVFIETAQKGWFSLDKSDFRLENMRPNRDRLTEEALKEYVCRFKAWMMTGKDESDQPEAKKYDELPFVKDLRLLMSVDLAKREDKIQYHSPSPSSQPDKGFEYFMEQRKKRYARNGGQMYFNKEEPLFTPSAIKGT